MIGCCLWSCVLVLQLGAASFSLCARPTALLRIEISLGAACGPACWLQAGDVALFVPSSLIVTLERVLGDETIGKKVNATKEP